MKILPQEKIGLYLAEAEKRGLLAAFYLELTTGLRRGELLALQWTDLDVESKTLSVTKQVNRINGELVVSPPKTRNSVRTLALPQQAVDLLISEHRKHPTNPYMFPSPKTGTMYDPDAFRRTHDKILKAIGAEHIGQSANGISRFWWAYHQFPVDSIYLLGDGKRFALYI